MQIIRFFIKKEILLENGFSGEPLLFSQFNFVGYSKFDTLFDLLSSDRFAVRDEQMEFAEFQGTDQLN